MGDVLAIERKYRGLDPTDPVRVDILRLSGEVERLRKIEDAGRSMNLRICGGELSCSEKDLMRFDAVLSSNPRPGQSDD